jgi:hypothetical protein
MPKGVFISPGIAGVMGATVGLGLKHEATHGSRKSKNNSHDVIDSGVPCFQGTWRFFPCEGKGHKQMGNVGRVH